MTGLSTIVVGTDGSASATAAVRWAAEHIGSGDLHVVYARHGQPPDSDAASDIEWQLHGEWTEPVRQAGIEATRHVVDGDPPRVLLDVAAEVGADALVVGAHGSGVQASRVLGSITRKLLHESSIPLVVVGPDAPSASETDRVIVCVGYGQTAATAAQWAAGYAADAGLPLTLLHVVTHRPLFPLDSPVDMVGSYLGDDISMEWAQSELDELRDDVLSNHPELDVSTLIEHGSAVASVLDASGQADAVVVGKRHEGIVSRHLIGPRLQRLVARGVSPTIVVPSCVSRNGRN
jgi:nucleotide-binding universal stress UspA family protein